MGYSCTAAADNTLDAITNICLRQTKCCNVFISKNKQYFWERGAENSSGAITGYIYDFLSCHKTGEFEIAPNGNVIKFPYFRIFL